MLQNYEALKKIGFKHGEEFFYLDLFQFLCQRLKKADRRFSRQYIEWLVNKYKVWNGSKRLVSIFCKAKIYRGDTKNIRERIFTADNEIYFRIKLKKYSYAKIRVKIEFSLPKV